MKSIIYKKHPSQVKLVLIDPKKVELFPYSQINKHFLAYLPNEEEPIRQLRVTCLSSKALINNGNGSFKEQDLPQRLQLFTIKNMVNYSEDHQNMLLFLADQDHRFYDGQTFGTGSTQALILDSGNFAAKHPVIDLQLAYSLECITMSKYGRCMVYLDKKGELKLNKFKF